MRSTGGMPTAMWMSEAFCSRPSCRKASIRALIRPPPEPLTAQGGPSPGNSRRFLHQQRLDVLQHLDGGLVALLGVDRHRLEDDRLERGRDRRIALARQLLLAFKMLVKDAHRV